MSRSQDNTSFHNRHTKYQEDSELKDPQQHPPAFTNDGLELNENRKSCSGNVFDSGVTSATSGTSSVTQQHTMNSKKLRWVQFPSEVLHPTCNEPWQNPYVYGSSPASNMTDKTTHSGDFNFDTDNLTRTFPSSAAYNQLDIGIASRIGGVDQPASNPNQPGSTTHRAGNFQEPAAVEWRFDTTTRKLFYFIDQFGKSRANR